MDDRSRYLHLSRRKMIQGSAAVGLSAFLAACGNNDAEVFNAATEPDASSSAPSSTTLSSTTPSSTAAETTAIPTTAAPITESETTKLETTAAEVSASEVAIAFTYAFGEGGKRLNPYIAVWVEDVDGNLIRTIALWFEQSKKGPRWLNDLKRWFDRDAASDGPDAIETVSSATRQPGSYEVSWDGRDDAGQPVPSPMFICIESSRERGPYSLMRESYDFTEGASLMFSDDGELSNASVVRI